MYQIELQLEVQRDGVPFRAADFTFWGVTFARDGNSFYATLATGGTAYLIEGYIAKKQARIIYEKVECPYEFEKNHTHDRSMVLDHCSSVTAHEPHRCARDTRS